MKRASTALLAIVLLALLGGCISAPQSCGWYKDPVYKRFCEASLLLASAEATVASYRELPTPPSNLNRWAATIATARVDLMRAQTLYASEGVLLSDESVALEAALLAIEGWLYGP